MRDFLQNNACGDLLGNEAQQQFAMKFELSAAAAEGEILTLGFLPARYQRNRKMLSLPQQLKLHQSCVAVAGCGGLGGYVIEELARLGVVKSLRLTPIFSKLTTSTASCWPPVTNWVNLKLRLRPKESRWSTRRWS